MIKLRPSKTEIKDILSYILEMNDRMGELQENQQNMTEEEIKASADIFAAYVESGFCHTLDPLTHMHLHVTYETLKLQGYIE